MNKIKIGLFAVLICVSAISCNKELEQTELECYFKDIDKEYVGFEMLSAEEIKSGFNYSPNLGEVSCMMAPNSREKFYVMGYLSSAVNLLYAELATLEDDADRSKYVQFYIEDGANGSALLYVYCGRGSGDMFVTLFKGASKERYQEVADSLIKNYINKEGFEVMSWGEM